MNETGHLQSEYISRVNRTIDYIDSNLSKPLTLEELASVANFSKFHFNRIFHAIAGETPFRFIMRVRMEKAAALILQNIKESLPDPRLSF